MSAGLEESEEVKLDVLLKVRDTCTAMVMQN
jgi:hypothetical protein